MQNRRDILRLRKLITIIIRLGSTANSIDCKNSYTMSWGFTVHRIGTAFSFESLALPALQWLCRLRSVISNRPNLRNENAKCWRCMGGGTGTHPVVAGALSMSLPVPRNSSDVARRQLSFSDLGKPCASLPVETRAKRAVIKRQGKSTVQQQCHRKLMLSQHVKSRAVAATGSHWFLQWVMSLFQKELLVVIQAESFARLLPVRAFSCFV